MDADGGGPLPSSLTRSPPGSRSGGGGRAAAFTRLSATLALRAVLLRRCPRRASARRRDRASLDRHFRTVKTTADLDRQRAGTSAAASSNVAVTPFPLAASREHRPPVAGRDDDAERALPLWLDETRYRAEPHRALDSGWFRRRMPTSPPAAEHLDTLAERRLVEDEDELPALAIERHGAAPGELAVGKTLSALATSPAAAARTRTASASGRLNGQGRTGGARRRGPFSRLRQHA